MILVPSKTIKSEVIQKSLNADAHASSSSMQTGEAQEICEAQKQYYCETFLSCIQALKQEELIKRSPKGKQITVTLDAMVCVV